MLKNIKADWLPTIQSEIKKDYFIKLSIFLNEEVKNKKIIYPQPEEILSAFKQLSLKKVKVIIIGQDPYHGENQAHGLSFSVKPDNKIPPSLRNIYKEIKSDLGIEPPEHGYLKQWSSQGVLLLNSVFTVEKSKPASHRKKGWEFFSDAIIEILNQSESKVFILWGNDAKKKGISISRTKHLVLESAHPSPFSFQKFKGNRHFSQTNIYLKSKGIKPINWKLDPI